MPGESSRLMQPLGAQLILSQSKQYGLGKNLSKILGMTAGEPLADDGNGRRRWGLK